MTIRIIIIKLGALGDVVRTLPVLPALKEKYPDSDIFWITKPNAKDLFEGNPYVKEVYTIPYEINNKEKFDLLYNFDIENEATDLAEKITADKKYGFYSQDGFPTVFNFQSEYYLNTIFDDDLKKSNKKTYQQMIFECAELTWKKQHCKIFLSKKDIEYANEFVNKNKINTSRLIGIHLGASPRWPSKVWHEDNLKEFIRKAINEKFNILLFAGKSEEKSLIKIKEDLSKEQIKVFTNDPNNTIKQFSSLVNICKKMICSDSFSLHISLALKKPTIGLFFCTSHSEIEDYGLLTKIISPQLKDFFPERMDEYNEELVKSISAEEVLKEIRK